MTQRSRAIIVLIFFLSTISMAGCATVEMQSRWTNPMAVPLSDTTWLGEHHYYDEDSRMRISVLNDADNLYIQLSSVNPSTKMMLLRAGFTVWLDNTGGTSKNFGIQFPLAQQSPMWGNGTDHKPRNSMEEMLQDCQYSLAIVNDAEETSQPMAVNQAEAQGIYPHIGMKQTYLLYELKVPLTATENNRTVGIGFETDKLESPAGRGSSRGGGGGGKKKGGKGGSQDGGKAKPIKIWMTIHLAQEASSLEK
ncbi:MAG: hypothetical protein PF495_06775 [Spirochaetales bacterium]|jgi:hypothetical protein|nr:hypothetical protein [Spirochaetales bacterium]